KKPNCFIFHTPQINAEGMESHREAQNQRVFRTLHVAPHKQQISTACAKPAHETLLAALNGIKQDWKPRSAMFLARHTARLEKIMMAQCY
ncbi:hypothetical protein, partial [Acetobacter fabarum]|uniref:hypothetical protein n=1 Tax=Acetobacter fabarum TaxID=483199 RepID=UPI0020A0A6D6